MLCSLHYGSHREGNESSKRWYTCKTGRVSTNGGNFQVLLALYTDSTALLIGIVIAMVFHLCLNGRPQVILSTECQQCKLSCPLHSLGCDPVAIMKATKGGRCDRGELCTARGAFEKACSRGLAPYY